jgi:hypothetical protein
MYTAPQDVISPQVFVSNLEPLYDGGEGGFSVAALHWAKNPRIAMRWNGEVEKGSTRSHPGSPQSRGLPTWFIVPEEFALAILDAVIAKGLLGGGTLDRTAAEASAQDAIAMRKHYLESHRSAGPASNDDLENQIVRIVRRMKTAGEI